MRAVLISLAVLAAQDPTPAQPSEFSNLTGKLVITGKEVLDPPLGQISDRVGLFWDGESAKRVYEAMPVKAVVDECAEAQRKDAGGLSCLSYAGGTEYSCSVGVLLASGETKPVAAC